MLHRFRRYPPPVLGEFPIFGTGIAAVYKLVDYRGWLSNIIADPQRIVEPFTYPRRSEYASSTKTSSISVIIASRNNETTLRQAIASLLNQSMCPLEIIVVDDHSDDGSWQIIRALADADCRIIPVRNSRQMGTGWSRNLGLTLAKGDYVTFQDGDDTSDPIRLEKQFSALTRFPGKKVATCNYVRVNELGHTMCINNRRTMKCIISMMFPRKEVLEKVGFFRTLTVSEDADYFERIKAAFGVESEVKVFRTMYRALFRPSSSFFATVRITRYDGSHLLFDRKEDAIDHWRSLARGHKEMASGSSSPYVPFNDFSASHRYGAAE